MSDAPSAKYVTFKSDKDVENYVASRYQTRLQKRVDRKERKCLKQLLLRHVGEQSIRVLDVPCGYGRLAPLLKSLGYHLNWADISESMVRYVSGRPEADDNTIARVATIDDLPFEDGSMDMVVCVRLLQHFMRRKDRIDALKEIHRVSGKWAMVSFYDRRTLHFLSKNIERHYHGRQRKIEMLTRKEFAAEAAECGFKVLEFAAWSPLIHAHTYAMMEKVD